MQNDTGQARTAERWRSLRPVERICWLVGAALIGSGLVHLVVAVADPRPWLGPLSWRKPVTFGLSFGTVLIAITWVAGYLPLTERRRRVLLGVFAADSVLEVAGITIQAWRHVPSHFNNTTAFNSVIAYSLAGGGAVLVVVLTALALAAFRDPTAGAPAAGAPTTGAPAPSMQLALRAGFALLLVGLASGAAMIARGEILIRQGHRGAAYDTAGFLKWTHAVTLHAVLVLPAIAWWLARTERTEAERVRIVRLATWTYVAAAAASVLVAVVNL
jgi:hypothetical protein